TRLLALLDAHVPACALLVFAVALLAGERTLLAARRSWSRGWLGALPGLGSAVPRQLSAAAVRSALALSLLVLALPPLLGAAGREAACWPRGWWLVVVAPWLAAAAARALAASPRAAVAGSQDRGLPGATWIVAALPVAARWQWAAWARAQRGRAAAWLLLPLLLAVPAGLSPPGTLLALMAVLALATLANLWSAALACVPRAAALLRATPWRSPSFLTAFLALPGTVLALAGSSLAALLVGTAGWAAGVPVPALVALALVHAAVVAAERQRPRRIAPALVLQLAIQVASLQAVPPLAPPLLLVQLALLARKALRR